MAPNSVEIGSVNISLGTAISRSRPSRDRNRTVADSRTIVLTGKAFGTTNLVLLDASGNALLDERILVSIDEGNTVRMYRQTDRTVLSCTPSCEQHQALGGNKGN